jgi:SsrA-binding protein
VKSVRLGKITLKDGYVLIHGGEVFLENVHIQEYAYANRFNHEPARRRKLLLNRKEIDRLDARISKKGYSVIPLRVYFLRGRAKVELGVGKGKREHDKRHDLKEKDARREMARALKH